MKFKTILAKGGYTFVTFFLLTIMFYVIGFGFSDYLMANLFMLMLVTMIEGMVKGGVIVWIWLR